MTMNARSRSRLINPMLRMALPAAFLLFAGTADAHHMEDGEMPSTFLDGLLSGLAHPVIGLDHLAFVVAIGILSLRFTRGWLIPLFFLVAALGGTVLHLQSVDLPGPEILVSASVLLFGVLLILPPHVPFSLITALAALAGIAHGYAYGESIVGAEAAPLGAYLLGFTAIQAGMALLSRFLASRLSAGLQTSAGHGSMQGRGASVVQRWAGFLISGAGVFFLYGPVAA
jgi:urease accessory protein